jgi:hypothetical protein
MAARWHVETFFGDTKDLRGLDQYPLISMTAIVRFWAPAVYSLLEEEQARLSQEDPRYVTIGRLAEHRSIS